MPIGGIIAIVLGCLIVACAVIVGVMFLLGYVTYATFVKRHSNDYDISKSPVLSALGPDYDVYKEFTHNAGEEFKEVPFRWVSILAADGAKLSGRFYEQEGATVTVVCVPGEGLSAYTDCGQYAKFYLDKGYNLLLTTARAHGESEGQHIGFGTLEANDLKIWIKELVAKRPDTKIFIHACSMGATAAMIASAQALPNVKGIIEDSGFTRAWDVLVYQIRQIYKLQPFPILHIAELFTKNYAKYNFRESAVKAVAMSGVPILFIHGGKDKLVPSYMCEACYSACTAPKEILIVEGAGHMQSYMREKEKYEAAIDSFMAKSLGETIAEVPEEEPQAE